MDIYEIDGVLYVPTGDALPEHQLYNKIMGRTQSYCVNSASECTFHRVTGAEYIMTQDLIDILLTSGYTKARKTKLQVKN